MTRSAMNDISESAADTSRIVGVEIRPKDLRYLAEVGILPTTGPGGDSILTRPEEVVMTAGRVHRQTELQDLFGGGQSLLVDSTEIDVSSLITFDEPVLIVFDRGLAVSYVPDQTRPEDVQRFVAAHRMNESPGVALAAFGSLTCTAVGEGLELLSVRSSSDTDRVVRRWQKLNATSGSPTYAESVTVPSLYGNKSRLTAFVSGVVGLHLPTGARILDAMCGTGIVARVLSRSFDVTSADANTYAAVLARGHNVSLSERATVTLLERLVVARQSNSEVLSDLCGDAIEQESQFLHGHVDQQSTSRYREFTASWTRFAPPAAALPSRLGQLVIERTERNTAFPYCLTTAYFANAYFGVRQSIELDSLRYAIDVVAPAGPDRDFLMAMLLTTASACASGPHFAQPPKLSGPHAMAELVEHRAKSVGQELDTLVLIAAKRPPLEHRLHVIEGDWRTSLTEFDDGAAEWGAGVYIDPPYSKLQYSRYYHVLNTLVRYDYPECIGQGRYPGRSRRFSSRFEYRPASALKEFESLFQSCSSKQLVTFVSYSDRGFMPIQDMLSLMQKSFPQVRVYSKRLRHHSQGVRLSGRVQATEYVLVGCGY